MLAGKIQKVLHVWALSRAMPANQPQSSTGKTAGDSSYLTIREASEGKRKGKEDICSVHRCFVCNTIAGYKSPRDHCEMSYRA